MEERIHKKEKKEKKEEGEKKKGEEEKPERRLNKFSKLPISKATKEGLKEAGYTLLTDIQKATIPHALAGRDILGAAKTGSGKTLAFIVPLIEKLFRSSWTIDDGLGALVITPTRELAVQIFEVLVEVGKKHHFSAALVTGGNDFEEEKKRLAKMNIIVCTPGRLLQHMDENPSFNCSNMQFLVLDEADRILDLGFKKTLKGIIDYLPLTRQTLLFSATQTKSIKKIAMLSMKVRKLLFEFQINSQTKRRNQSTLLCTIITSLPLRRD